MLCILLRCNFIMSLYTFLACEYYFRLNLALNLYKLMFKLYVTENLVFNNKQERKLHIYYNKGKNYFPRKSKLKFKK